MRLIRQELIKIKNRAVWSWCGFSHVAKTEGSLWQWIIANIVSGSLTIFLPITYTQQALILAGGILILAAECMNTAIERVVDDISSCLLYTSPSPRDRTRSRMPSSA